MNLNMLMGRVTKSLKFADGVALRAEFDAQILALLGEKTEADIAAAGIKKKKPKAEKKKENKSSKAVKDSDEVSRRQTLSKNQLISCNCALLQSCAVVLLSGVYTLCSLCSGSMANS